MHDEVLELLDAIQTNRSLEVRLEIHENGRYAPLALDLSGLHAVLFAGGTTEFGYAYASYVVGSNETTPYDIGLLRDFDGFLKQAGSFRRSWVDLYEERRDEYYRIFRDQLYRRTGGFQSLASDEILRIELVEIAKQNPTVFKIIATGTMAAVIWLGGCFGAVHLMKQQGAQQCQAESLHYANELTDKVMKQARLEGKFTEHHERALAKIQDTVAATMAACGSPLDKSRLDIDPKTGKVIIQFGRL